MTNYTSETFFYQNDEEFRCGWDIPENLNAEGMIQFLAEILSDEDAFEDENYEEFDFYGLTPDEFARKLVENKEEMKELGTEWSIDISSVDLDVSIPDFSNEDFKNLSKRASEGDKISQELSKTLFDRHIKPELEKYLQGGN